MHLRSIASAAVLFSAALACHADTFSFTLNGGSGAFNGTGTISATEVGTTDAYLVDSISGTGITGLISPFSFDGNSNDNLIYPSAATFVDGAGLAFTDQNGPDTFSVDLFSSSGSYFATFIDEDSFTSTVPVSFQATAATPEPVSATLLATGLAGVAAMVRRRRLS